MSKSVPVPLVIAAIVIVLLVVAGGIWHGLQPPLQPAPESATNISHGTPPPMSARVDTNK